ncbi:MAG: hypothetical protein IJE08_04645 [Clostridia bacterium]|nr:hypothetical protein [Clostridia bacterium]
MLYPHSKDPDLSRELFENPGSEYRCTPFWAWNAKLEKEELLRQIEVFKEMGMGGFHMHSRSGMATHYLSEDFMDLVKACRDKAIDENMLCWLYDEDRWPSGAAGGLVTKDRQYSTRHLLFTPVSYEEQGIGEHPDFISSSRGSRQGNGTLLAKYSVTLENGFLSHYERIPNDQPDGENMWYAYLEISTSSPWYNNETYLNTLDPKAVQKFVEVTHEGYKKAVGESFGGVIPAIFTDEPQFSRKQSLGFSTEKKDVTLPFTDDLPETFRAAYGEELLDCLPELFWDLPDGKVSLIRYHYHDHIAERFAAAFADTIGTWCKANNIMLTGHMMEEPTLESQTAALGEAMRSYRSFQLPGIDMLCDWREFTTAKQAQSAAHQYGYPGVLSELYGVTNWDFDFRGHKLAGDWQAALGVTVRVPHLSWYSMGGAAKRDYPASISYQIPWHKEYSYIENYFSRINAALTRGKPAIRVGVVHPVESYWLHWGPKEQTAAIREEMDANFQNLAKWLLTGLIDYNYISESLLPDQCREASAPLTVGLMKYDAVIVPACETLRSTTVERLEAFAADGGKLIFAGRVPALVDAIPSDRVQKLAEKAVCIPLTGVEVLNALEEYRELDIRSASGARTSSLLHQMRIDGDNRWLFICQAYNPRSCDNTRPIPCELRLKGRWYVENWNALTGKPEEINQEIKGNTTYVRYLFDAHDSLLLKLIPYAGQETSAEYKLPGKLTEYRAAMPVSVELSEPNVLILDQAEYSLDGEPWHDTEEILALDNKVRALLKWKDRNAHFAQPWVTAGVDFGDPKHTLALRFTIDSRVAVSGAKLAMEDSQYAAIELDGQPVEVKTDGWFTDKAIKTIPLPDFGPGVHQLVVTFDFKRVVNPEWMYLLGDFGVVQHGATAHLVEPVKSLYYGDACQQGLPFYGGNVTYVIPCEAGENGLTVETPQFRGGLIRVELDGEDQGVIAYAPYKLHMNAAPGKHTLKLRVYGNRVNCFGSLHNCDTTLTWYGPAAWNSTGKSFSYEYRLRPFGLLIAPRLYK